MMRMTAERRAERLAFLKRRQKGIGGSDMPVILGLSTYIPKGRSGPRNARDIYNDKTQPIREEDIEDDTIHQLRGHYFEPMALDHYRVKTGRVCHENTVATVHPDYPAMAVSIDFDIDPDESREEGFRGKGVGETKSPMFSVIKKIIEKGIRQSEIVQLQTNIAAAQLTWGSFCYFTMEHDAGPVIVADQLEDPILGKFLMETGQRFWDECVVPRVPPIPSEWRLLEDENAPKIIEMSGEMTVIDDELFTALVKRCLDRKDLSKEAEVAYRETQAQVFDYLTEYPCPDCAVFSPDQADVCDTCDSTGVTPLGKVQVPGLARLTVVTKKGQVKKDWAALQDSLPLDRDAVTRWLMSYVAPIDDAGEVPDKIDVEEIGRMLFECGVDFKAFEAVGYGSQYLLNNRSADE